MYGGFYPIHLFLSTAPPYKYCFIFKVLVFQNKTVSHKNLIIFK